jgi:hypothetical protein
MFVVRSVNVRPNIPREYSGNNFGRLQINILRTFTPNVHRTKRNIHRLSKVHSIVSWAVLSTLSSHRLLPRSVAIVIASSPVPVAGQLVEGSSSSLRAVLRHPSRRRPCVATALLQPGRYFSVQAKSGCISVLLTETVSFFLILSFP